MHWTFALLASLATLCLAANAWRLIDVGNVRPVGLAVCGGWILQQTAWLETGQDSLAIFLLCDGIILWLAARERHWTSLLIAALMVVCWACYGLNLLWGPERNVWIANYTAVLLQFVLGLPWPAIQRTGHTVSHGPLRRTT